MLKSVIFSGIYLAINRLRIMKVAFDRLLLFVRRFFAYLARGGELSWGFRLTSCTILQSQNRRNTNKKRKNQNKTCLGHTYLARLYNVCIYCSMYGLFDVVVGITGLFAAELISALLQTVTYYIPQITVYTFRIIKSTTSHQGASNLDTQPMFAGFYSMFTSTTYR